MSFAVPETAGIRRNLVRKHNCAVAQSSEFKFEIDKLDVDFRKECGQNFVDFQSVFFYRFKLLRRAETHCKNMAVVNHGIAQCIVLVAKFENGAFEFRAFGETYAFCKRTRRNVADNNLKRNDADGLDRRFPVGKLFDKMSRNAFFFEHFHEIVRNAVVDNALARDCTLLFAVKCGCIVLIVNDINTFDIGCVNLLCLAFV